MNNNLVGKYELKKNSQDNHPGGSKINRWFIVEFWKTNKLKPISG